jgi:dTMP kinase
MPGSVERLLFLPGYDAAYRHIAKAMPDRISRIVVGLRGTDDVVDEIERELLTVLRVPLPLGGRDE